MKRVPGVSACVSRLRCTLAGAFALRRLPSARPARSYLRLALRARRVCRVLLCLPCLAPAAGGSADEMQEGSNATSSQVEPSSRGKNRWYFQTSLLTVHFQNDDERNNQQWLLNLERHSAREWIAGLALFQNSFDQPSQYLYAAKLWRPLDALPALHVKLSAGLLHGYKGEHEDSVPFNDYGVAPAIVPAIGLSGRRFATEIVVYNINGLMWTVGAYFR
jgi:hypothetical protein